MPRLCVAFQSGVLELQLVAEIKCWNERLCRRLPLAEIVHVLMGGFVVKLVGEGPRKDGSLLTSI